MPENSLPHVSSSLDQEIVVMTLTTMTRLFELDPDAFTLYAFYCRTAKLQANQIGYTNKIKATTQYCLNGLGWGRKKFDRTKQLLIDNGFIEQITRRNKLGPIEGYYIQINFLLNSHRDSYSLDASNDTSSDKSFDVSNDTSNLMHQKQHVAFEYTNAVNKNISAVNKNIIIAPEHDQSYSKKANEYKNYSPSHSNIAHSSEKRSSKNSLIPCTHQELWDLAKQKNVPLSKVLFVHNQVLEMIEDGNKYKSKTVYRTLAKWIDLGMSRGQIQHMDEVEQLSFELLNPQRQHKLQLLVQGLREGGAL